MRVDLARGEFMISRAMDSFLHKPMRAQASLEKESKQRRHGKLHRQL